MGQCLARLTRRTQNRDLEDPYVNLEDLEGSQEAQPVDPSDPFVDTDNPGRVHTQVQGASVEIEKPTTKSYKDEKKDKDESLVFFEPDNENPAAESTKVDLSKGENVPVECTDVDATSVLAMDSGRRGLRPGTYSIYPKYTTEEQELSFPGFTEEQEPSLPGFNMLDRTTFSVRGGDTTQSFIRKHAGYRIHFPPDCLSNPTNLRVAAAMTGLFEFPENTTPVSGVIHVQVEPQVNFEKPVTLELEHCCSIESKQDADLLSFAVADTTTGVFPYRFQLVDGGLFSRGNHFGTISVPKFCLWTIVRSSVSAAWNWLLARELPDHPEDSDSDESSSSSREESRNSIANSSENGNVTVHKSSPVHAATKYVAYVYTMPWRGIYFIWKVVLAIVRDTELCYHGLEKVLTKDNPYKQQNSFMVFFDGQNDISLEGVEGGIMVDGWKIRPLNPTKISIDAVNSVDGGESNILAKCSVKLDFIWEAKGVPGILMYKIQLRGTQGTNDYFQLNLDPFQGLPQQLETEAKVFPQNAGMIASSEQPSVTFDQLIEHVGIRKDLLNQTCSPEHLQRLAEHLPNWLKYAEVLKLTDLQIQEIKIDLHLDGLMKARKVLKLWHQSNGFKATYSGFIEVCLQQRDALLAEKICRLLKGLLSK